LDLGFLGLVVEVGWLVNCGLDLNNAGPNNHDQE
jgi:hypothetical protein